MKATTAYYQLGLSCFNISPVEVTITQHSQNLTSSVRGWADQSKVKVQRESRSPLFLFLLVGLYFIFFTEHVLIWRRPKSNNWSFSNCIKAAVSDFHQSTSIKSRGCYQHAGFYGNRERRTGGPKRQARNSRKYKGRRTRMKEPKIAYFHLSRKKFEEKN